MTDKIIASLIAAGLISACTTYDQPAQSEPHASISFQRSAGEGGNLLTQGRIISYFVANNESCSEAPRVAAFATGDLAGSQKTIRLPVDSPVKLLAWLRINDAGFEGGTYQRVGQFDCSAAAKFTPADGQSYIASFSVDDEANCEFLIIDSSNDSAPIDLDVSEAVCAEKPKMIPE